MATINPDEVNAGVDILIDRFKDLEEITTALRTRFTELMTAQLAQGKTMDEAIAGAIAQNKAYKTHKKSFEDLMRGMNEFKKELNDGTHSAESFADRLTSLRSEISKGIMDSNKRNELIAQKAELEAAAFKLTAAKNFKDDLGKTTGSIAASLASGLKDALNKSLLGSSGLDAGAALLTGAVNTANTAVQGVAGGLQSAGGAAMMAGGKFKLVGIAATGLGTVLGGLSSAVSELAKTGITMMMAQTKGFIRDFNALSQAGVVFSNGLKGMAEASNLAQLTITQMTKVMSENSENITSSGMTMTEGAKKMAAVMKASRTSMDESGRSMSDRMLAMGIGFEEQAALSTVIMRQNKMASDSRIRSDEEIAAQTLKYATLVKTLTDLRGKEGKSELDAAKIETQKAGLLAKYGAAEMQKFEAALTTLPKELHLGQMQIWNTMDRKTGKHGVTTDANTMIAMEDNKEVGNFMRNSGMMVINKSLEEVAAESQRARVAMGAEAEATIRTDDSKYNAGQIGNNQTLKTQASINDQLVIRSKQDADFKAAYKKNEEAQKNFDPKDKSNIVGLTKQDQEFAMTQQNLAIANVKNFATALSVATDTIIAAMKELQKLSPDAANAKPGEKGESSSSNTALYAGAAVAAGVAGVAATKAATKAAANAYAGAAGAGPGAPGPGAPGPGGLNAGKVLKAVKGAAIVGAIGYGVDAAAGAMGVGKNTINEQQDDENWKKMSIFEKSVSSIARGIETGADWMFLDNMANQARSDRIKSETLALTEKNKESKAESEAKQKSKKSEAQAAVAAQLKTSSPSNMLANGTLGKGEAEDAYAHKILIEFGKIVNSLTKIEAGKLTEIATAFLDMQDSFADEPSWWEQLTGKVPMREGGSNNQQPGSGNSSSRRRRRNNQQGGSDESSTDSNVSTTPQEVGGGRGNVNPESVVPQPGEVGGGRGNVNPANVKPQDGGVSTSGQPNDSSSSSLPGGVSGMLEQIARGEGTDDATAQKHGLKSGYDVSLGYGKYGNKGNKPLSEMTFGEVKEYQRSMLRDPKNKFNSSAVGKYQFISGTLKEQQAKAGYKDDDLFDAAAQDKMGTQLLKQRGLDKFLQGKISGDQLQTGLAKEWASVADPRTGRSFYGQHTGTSDAKIKAAIGNLTSPSMASSAGGTSSSTNNLTRMNGGVSSMVSQRSEQYNNQQQYYNTVAQNGSLPVQLSGAKGPDGVRGKDPVTTGIEKMNSNICKLSDLQERSVSQQETLVSQSSDQNGLVKRQLNVMG